MKDNRITEQEYAVKYKIKAKKGTLPSVEIRSSSKAVELARKLYKDDLLIYESSFIFMFNTALVLKGYAKISQGGISGTVVDSTLIAKLAIDSTAKSVILIHNHPSGNTNPSNSDIALTKEVKEVLSICKIALNDHIIITEDSFYSFADEGTL